MRNGKKILTGCLLAIAVSTLMVGCGNNDNNTAGTETTTGVKDNNTIKNETTENNTIRNDGAENKRINNDASNEGNNNADGGVLEDVGAGIGEAGDDIIDGAADAVDRLADDGIDSENTENTNTGVQ